MKDKIHIWFTLGPSTIKKEVLEKMFLSGATGCRLTFSYGTAQLQIERARILKSIANELNKSCFVIGDLAGEKFRISDFDKPELFLEKGEEIFFLNSIEAIRTTGKYFYINNRSFFEQVKKGNKIIVGDGSVVLDVSSCNHERILAVVIAEGIINPNRGLNVQGSDFSPKAFTEKDISDLETLLSSDSFDAVALSFVNSAKDILKAREIMHSFNKDLPIIAKIETAKGIKNLKEIALEADWIMAARGDLALNLHWTELPNAVNEIQKVSQETNKPWILATQIMEGFERFSMPTRAEICDLAHWLSKGASGVLLSYETVFGKRPIEAITAVSLLTSRWADF